MESASPERQSEQPPGHIANLIGFAITITTLALPLYAISNFSAAEVTVQPPPSTYSMRVQK